MNPNILPTFDQLIQPTLDALHALNGRASNQQIYEWIIEHFLLSDEIRNRLHKVGKPLTEVEYRLMWARTYLKKVNLIDNPKPGTWTLTELGQQTTLIIPRDIVRLVNDMYGHKSQGEKDDEDNLMLTLDLEELNGSQDNSQTTLTPTAVSLTADYPEYDEVRPFLEILNGTSYSAYREMVNAIWTQVGSPQEQVDWTKPDEWIPNRLGGEIAALALNIWRSSNHHVNPRYTRGCWYLAVRHHLLQRNSQGQIQVTSQGQEFISSPLGELEARIDLNEGVLLILRFSAEKGPVRRRDLLDEFGTYCRTYTTIQSESAIKSFLYDRLRNLVGRQLLISSGQNYEITAQGLSFLKEYADYIPGTREQNEQQTDIHTLAKQLRDTARNELQSYLLEMNPYKFEQVIKLLLEEIGYSNVVTTSATNDKGVDVIANIELGISSVREVVQVKRHKGTINRVVLDQLRGSLHRFDAVRGTIITTGTFSKGALEAAFERGAAPITLIDGEKLLVLLMENEIGVKKNPVYYYEFTPGDLSQFSDEEEI